MRFWSRNGILMVFRNDCPIWTFWTGLSTNPSFYPVTVKSQLCGLHSVQRWWQLTADHQPLLTSWHRSSSPCAMFEVKLSLVTEGQMLWKLFLFFLIWKSLWLVQNVEMSAIFSMAWRAWCKVLGIINLITWGAENGPRRLGNINWIPITPRPLSASLWSHYSPGYSLSLCSQDSV